MKISSLLIRLGLSDDEAKIYLALLRLGKMNVTEIAKHTGLYRPMVYKLLPRLDDRQLIAEQKVGKRSYYVAENPAHLQLLVEKLSADLETVSEELFETYHNGKRRPTIKNFEGKEGIRRVFDDMMSLCKKGDVIYRYESPKNYTKNKAYYPRLYLHKAAGAKESIIEKFVITNEKTHKLRSARLERFSKFVPASFDRFEYDITQLIYKNRVVFIDYKREAANVIESTRYAEFQKQLFKLLFKNL
jgi:HTH-type transcriptional regulator, sugar sensing transcriptional regulator